MATTFQSFSPDWWSQVLQEFEPAQYYSSYEGLGFAGGSPRRRRFFEDAYQGITQDYYQTAGTAMRQGLEPTTFQEFLETNPWTARYGRLPQTARGMTGVMASPRTRFLYNF